MTQLKRYVIGADLGGTNVRAALVDEGDGAIVARSENVPSEAMTGAGATVLQIAKAIEEAIAQSGVDRALIRGVGLGVPGHVRPATGMVIWAPNFHNQWRDVPLAQMVSEQVGLPVHLNNDANLAALGEIRYGIGRGTRHLVMLTFGTGVGGGVIIDGRMLTGHDDGGAELGLIVIAAGDNARGGNAAYGSLEGLVQRDAIVERAARKLALGRASTLVAREVFVREDLNPKIIAEAALAGDAVAQETMDETGYYIGLGVASFINVFNPEMIVIGGGIALAGDLLLAPIIRTTKANAEPTLFATCRIVLSALGDNAGVLGAAALVTYEMDGPTADGTLS